MANKIIGVLMGITTCVILLGALLVPTISGIQGENVVTYTNEGVPYSDDPGDFTLYNTSSSVWVFNGDDVSIVDVGAIFISDSVQFQRSDASGKYMFLYSSAGAVLASGNSSQVMFKIEYTEESGTIVFTKYTDLTGETVDTTASYTCTSILVLDPNGEYVSVSSSESAYVNSIDQIYSGNRYYSTNLTTCFYGHGAVVSLGNASFTASASATLTSAGSDVYQASAYTVTFTNGTGTESVTPMIYVPATVTGHTTDQNMQNALYGAVAVIAVAFVAISSILIISRKD